MARLRRCTRLGGRAYFVKATKAKRSLLREDASSAAKAMEDESKAKGGLKTCVSAKRTRIIWLPKQQLSTRAAMVYTVKNWTEDSGSFGAKTSNSACALLPCS